jgi:hypothetical protein
VKRVLGRRIVVAAVVLLFLVLTWIIYRNTADERVSKSIQINMPAGQATRLLKDAGARLERQSPHYEPGETEFYWRMRGGGLIVIITDHEGRVTGIIFAPVWHMPL